MKQPEGMHPRAHIIGDLDDNASAIPGAAQSIQITTEQLRGMYVRK